VPGRSPAGASDKYLVSLWRSFAHRPNRLACRGSRPVRSDGSKNRLVSLRTDAPCTEFMKASTRISRDPVCGRGVTAHDSRYTTTLRNLVFHFCSEQCLERFTEHPALYTGAQRIADIRPILKKRRLKFAPVATETLAACERLLGMNGVTRAAPGDGCVLVEYDLRRATLKQIEAVATGFGLIFKGGIHGFRRHVWRFFEYNELENAGAGKSPCCSRPPPRWR
jgi:YHS domain-containing protein